MLYILGFLLLGIGCQTQYSIDTTQEIRACSKACSGGKMKKYQACICEEDE